MKALIWIGCMIIGGFIMTFIPSLPLLIKTLILAGEMYLASYLCKKWDKYNQEEKEDENENEEEK